MNKFINARESQAKFRWRLLVSVSATALLASAYSIGEAQAADNDSDRPLLWIELGGQSERMSGGQELYTPPFEASFPDNFFSPATIQKPLLYSLGEEGSIAFEPEGSDWIFSASIRFGRSNGVRHRHQQTANAGIPVNVNLGAFGFPSKYVARGTYYPYAHVKFSDARVSQNEKHTVLDFQAGKDVGLGMFGKNGSSTLSAGVRFAQFSSKANVNIKAMPDLQYRTAPVTSFSDFVNTFKYADVRFHAYTGIASIQRDFRGLGPSLSWNASVPFAGDSASRELTFDWGVNAAVLFGRQKARSHHQTTTRSYLGTHWQLLGGAGGGCRKEEACFKPGQFEVTYSGGQHTKHGAYAIHTNTGGFSRTRTVTVPNVGGFAGLSFRYVDAKISLGYKADFFFGAIDGGIDTAKKENRGFHGPYASISIGLGD